MKKNLFLFLLGLPIFVQAESSLCTYNMSVNNSKSYSLQQYTDFIKSEFRPQLNNKPNTFEVVLSKECNRQHQQLVMQFNSQTYTLKTINHVDINANLKKYSNQNLTLDIGNINQQFESALKEDFSSAEHLETKQNILKFFNFIFSEAARFEDINDVTNNMINHHCVYQRSDYSNLLHTWNQQSQFIYFDKNRSTDHLYKGGKDCDFSERYCLLAPISHSVVEAFNQSKQNEAGQLLPVDHCENKSTFK